MKVVFEKSRISSGRRGIELRYKSGAALSRVTNSTGLKYFIYLRGSKGKVVFESIKKQLVEPVFPKIENARRHGNAVI